MSWSISSTTGRWALGHHASRTLRAGRQARSAGTAADRTASRASRTTSACSTITSAAPATTIERRDDAHPPYGRAPARPRHGRHGRHDLRSRCRAMPTAGDLSREDWLGLLLDREVTARDNKRLGRRLPPGPIASERRGRGHRLPHVAWSGPRALPQARRPADRICHSQHLVIGGPTNNGQIVAGLRSGTQGLPGRLLGAVSARSRRGCSPNWCDRAW